LNTNSMGMNGNSSPFGGIPRNWKPTYHPGVTH